MRAFILIAALLLAPLVSAQQGFVEAYRFDHSGYIDLCHPEDASGVRTCPTFWIDFSQDPSGATITSNSGHVLTKAGAPTREHDGTYPDGIDTTQGYAHAFDGAADYYSRADDGTLDPAGDFSVCVAITPYSVTGTQAITGKDGGWELALSTTSVTFTVTKSGGGGSTNTKTTAVALNRMSIVCAAYDYTSDGSSIPTIYIDGLTVSTKSDCEGPVVDTASTFDIAHDNTANLFDGLIHASWIWDGLAITEADHDFLCTQYRNMVTDHGQAVTVTTANPPMVQVAASDSGTEPFLRPMPANTTQIGPDGVETPSARTNLAQRGTLETCAGGDFTGWAEVETAGNGTAAITCETGTMSDGQTSAKITLTGTTSVSSLTSVCLTTGIGADLYIQAMLKGTASTEESMLQIIEWDAADCTSYLDSDIIYNGNPGTTWAQHGGLQAAADWHADTSSYQVRVQEDGNDGVSLYVDSVEAVPGSEARPGYCGADTDASCACSASVPQAHSPISADGDLHVKMTAESPWAGVELVGSKNVLSDGSPSIANSLLLYVSSGTDEPIWYVRDVALGEMYLLPNVLNWAANTGYDLEFYRAPDGSPLLGMWWNGAWYTTEAGAGTGHRGAAQSTLYFGGYGTTGGDVKIRDVEIYRRVQK